MVRLSVDGLENHDALLVVMGASSPDAIHERLACAIEGVDPDAACALRSSGPPCPDARLYVAAWEGYADRCAELLAIGANPIRRTPDGDCAARVGIAHGLLAEFEPWWTARHQRTGETGLHHLARHGEWADICQVIEWGGDLYEPNLAGITPADGMGLRPSDGWVLIQAALERVALRSEVSMKGSVEKPRRRM